MPSWTTRTDHQTSDLIQQAIVVEQGAGAVAAWTFLVRNQIPEAIIARVLDGPRRDCAPAD